MTFGDQCCNPVRISLDSSTLERLQYVADYFEWPVSRVASYAVMRAFSSVSFGDDLSCVDWGDPRRSENK